MSDGLLTRWTGISTNIAVVVGLLFVGLEFRHNTRAIEADRHSPTRRAYFLMTYISNKSWA
jgi:hypothetical protein